MGNWYYTRDGQQTGPVPEEELRDLVASGQVPQSALAWTEGMAEWQAISSISVFAQRSSANSSPAPAEAPLNPYSAPVSDMSQPAPQSGGLDDAEEIIPGSEPISVGPCISRAFELTKQHFGQILLVGIVMIAISFGASLVMEQVDRLLGLGDFGNWRSSNDVNFQFSVGSFNALIVGLAFAIPLASLAWMVAYRWMQYGHVVSQNRLQ